MKRNTDESIEPEAFVFKKNGHWERQEKVENEKHGILEGHRAGELNEILKRNKEF